MLYIVLCFLLSTLFDLCIFLSLFSLTLFRLNPSVSLNSKLKQQAVVRQHWEVYTIKHNSLICSWSIDLSRGNSVLMLQCVYSILTCLITCNWGHDLVVLTVGQIGAHPESVLFKVSHISIFWLSYTWPFMRLLLYFLLDIDWCPQAAHHI